MLTILIAVGCISKISFSLMITPSDDNGFQPLTIITKCSILDVVAFLDPPLETDSITTLTVIMLDRVLLGSRFGRKQVLFFHTTKKTLSSSVLECGIVKMKQTTF